MISVVAGIICNKKNEVLISFRPSHVPQGNLWEFPGGKVETGESSLDALIRELQEEIGITVIEAKPFAHNHYDYGNRLIHLDVWWVEKFSGSPSGKEGQEISWAPIESLHTLKFPEANYAILDAIKKIVS